MESLELVLEWLSQKSIVDLMGGTIHLTSKQGEGSEFIVTLECELADKTVQDKQSSCPKAEKNHLDYSGKKYFC